MDYHTQGSGIYKLTNTANGKFYIGSTTHFGVRWYKHFESVEWNGCRRLKSAIMKYGKEAFVAEILEIVVPDRNTLREREQHYLDTLHPFGDVGYNLSKTASPSNFGTVHTDDSRRKMSEAKKGEKNPMWGRTNKSPKREEWFRKMKGTKRTEEQRSKCGKHLAKPVCAYTKQGILVATYPSQAEAVRSINGDATAMWKCLTRKPNFNTHKGFVWRYSDESF